MIPRFVHKWWAHLWGFYWLPCPVCGREYGGHQAQSWGHAFMLDDGSWRMTCPDCPVDYRPLSSDFAQWVVTSPGLATTYLNRKVQPPFTERGTYTMGAAPSDVLTRTTAERSSPEVSPSGGSSDG